MKPHSMQLVSLASIAVSLCSRTFNEQHAAKLAGNIKAVGKLFQPIGVLPDGDAYRLVWGRHRLEAFRLLGQTQIPAFILPPDTPPEEELRFSMVENNLRRDESFEDTVARVEQLASRLKCSSRQAAAHAEVKPAYFSRCKSISNKLTPEAKSLARQHKLGMSDLYLIASKATSPAMQLEAIQARIGGLTRDELGAWIKSRVVPAAKKVTPLVLGLTACKVSLKLELPPESEYADLDKAWKELTKRLFAHRKSVPVRLLPELFS